MNIKSPRYTHRGNALAFTTRSGSLLEVAPVRRQDALAFVLLSKNRKAGHIHVRPFCLSAIY
jgi:hypothetical protein